MRLDQRLRELRPDLSWSRIRSAIERGQVTVDDLVTRDPGQSVASANVVSLDQDRPALRSARIDLPRLSLLRGHGKRMKHVTAPR